MKTSDSDTLKRVFFQWLTQEETQMAVNFSLLLLPLPGNNSLYLALSYMKVLPDSISVTFHFEQPDFYILMKIIVLCDITALVI